MIRLAALCAVLAGPALADAHPNAQRIISVGGSVTEIVYALGEQDRLVGRDTTSSYPAAARALPDVGYMRRLSPEGVLSINPDLVLAEDGAGPPETIALLQGAALPMETIPGGHDRDAVGAKILAVALALGVPEKGRALSRQVLADIDAAITEVAQQPRPPRVLFVLSMQGGRIMAAGDNTSAQGILDLVGAQNALSGVDGYKLVTDEAIANSQADVILMMDRNAGRHQADVLLHPAILTTPAGVNQRLIQMDGLKLLGFSVRTGAAVRELSAALTQVQG